MQVNDDKRFYFKWNRLSISLQVNISKSIVRWMWANAVFLPYTGQRMNKNGRIAEKLELKWGDNDTMFLGIIDD